MAKQNIANEIKDQLASLGRGSRQGHRPSAQKDFGVYTQDLRLVVKDFKQRLKGETDEFVLQIANDLIDQNITESRQVAYELIAANKEAREALNDQIVSSLARRLDNWACVDLFCSAVAGAAWREGRVSDSLIVSWANSEDLWLRRASVVCTVALNTKSRGGKGDAKRTLERCEFLLDDSEVMVQKAISWALRELVPWDRSVVVAFLAQHQDRVSARVKREVIKKLETGKKN